MISPILRPWPARVWALALMLGLAPLAGGCQMSEPGEFRLNGQELASEYFPLGKQRQLARAAAAGQAQEVAALIAQGADPNARGKDTMTPLMWAVFARSAQGVEALLKGGAKAQDFITLTRSGGVTIRVFPIMMAARFNQPEMMKALLEHGADPETKGDGANTVLVEASHCFSCFRLLVDHGADVNREIDGAPGNTATDHGVANRHYESVLYALQKGYRINLDELNYRVETSRVSKELEPLRAQILALLKTKGVKPWVPPYLRKQQQ